MAVLLWTCKQWEGHLRVSCTVYTPDPVWITSISERSYPVQVCNRSINILIVIFCVDHNKSAIAFVCFLKVIACPYVYLMLRTVTVVMLHMFVRSYHGHQSAMSNAERNQLDKFYEKCVFQLLSISCSYCHVDFSDGFHNDVKSIVQLLVTRTVAFCEWCVDIYIVITDHL